MAILAWCLLLAAVSLGIVARSFYLQKTQGLASAAIATLETDPERSLVLAVKAASTRTEMTPDVVDEPDRALLLHGSGSSFAATRIPSRDVAFSPDGKWLATAVRDKIAKVWDADDLSKTPRTFSGHTDKVQDVAFGFSLTGK